MHGLRKMPVGMFINFLIVSALVVWGIMKLGEQPGSVELRQGQRIMYQVMGAKTLRKAGFYDAYPSATPSDFVSFVQTDRGERLWPQTVGDYKSSSIPGAERDPGRVLQPDSLSFAAHSPDPSAGKQIVYVPLDDAGQMEVRGYEDPQAEPVFVYTWDFPTDAGEVPLR